MKERNICFSLARSGWIGIFFPDRRENPSMWTNPSGRNRDRRVISSPGTGFLSTQCLMKTLVPGSQLVTTFLCEEMLSAVRWKDAHTFLLLASFHEGTDLNRGDSQAVTICFPLSLGELLSLGAKEKERRQGNSILLRDKTNEAEGRPGPQVTILNDCTLC